MSVDRTRALMDRYFAAMGAEEDFSAYFSDEVTWLMVDSGQEVRGATAVRDHLLELHAKMESGESRPLVVTDGQAYLEGSAVNAGPGTAGLAFCLVYEVVGERIAAMRCYGTLARLMPLPG